MQAGDGSDFAEGDILDLLRIVDEEEARGEQPESDAAGMPPQSQAADADARFIAVLNLCLLRVVQQMKASRNHTSILLDMFRLVLRRWAGEEISKQLAKNYYFLVTKQLQPVVQREWRKMVICSACSAAYR